MFKWFSPFIVITILCLGIGVFSYQYSGLEDKLSKLQGEYETLKRLRIGKYRALFEIIDNELVILVIDIDSIGDIYKRL